jgi:hypothetical protein
LYTPDKAEPAACFRLALIAEASENKRVVVTHPRKVRHDEP